MKTLLVILIFVGLLLTGADWSISIGFAGNFIGLAIALSGCYIAHKERLLI